MASPLSPTFLVFYGSCAMADKDLVLTDSQVVVIEQQHCYCRWQLLGLCPAYKMEVGQQAHNVLHLRGCRSQVHLDSVSILHYGFE